MTNRLFNPDPAFSDATGAALAGAQIFFYATGTSTKQATYTDKNLTIANTNPIVLDANGRSPTDIWMQTLPYKVVLAPANDTDPPTSPIWTRDPVWTSDYSTVAQFQGSNGNPNGQLAGTAGSATVAASVAWDYVNDILYVCTTTGTSTTAVWTAVNPATGASTTLPIPQGRLTLTTQTPVMNADVTAATTVYYTPYTGLLVPIYNGTIFVSTSIVSELSIGLVAAHAASQIYDLYVFLLSGVPTLGSGPSWSAGSGGSVTAGSCARGTGAGGAALSRLNGTLTNAVNMTMTYGTGGSAGSTTTVSANKGTYVGSMFMDGTNGQVSCYVSWGQSRKWGIWNAYNRTPIAVQCGDSTASWGYTTATIRESNGSTANTIVIFSGLAEEPYALSFTDTADMATAGTNAGIQIGIGFNNTTAFSGVVGTINYSGVTTLNLNSSVTSSFPAAPSLGINNVNALEKAFAPDGATMLGTTASMLLLAQWRG
jgi:hypothetical protein